eukprot:c19760_g1_i1 orf=330-1700(-)
MAKSSKLTGALWGLLLKARARSAPAPSRPLHSPPYSHQKRASTSPFQHHQLYPALGKQVRSWVPVRQASSVSSASVPLIQATAGKAEVVGNLVAKGVEAQKQVGLWLFGCSAWVFSMVIIGGVTRLTKSGLSMTDWKFMGSFPPMSPSEWQAEFEKYQNSPEYKRVNKGMNVDDFKLIYWIEYAHRMWGRGLGLFFTGPLVYFLCKGYITRQLGLRLASLLVLGAGQGLVGWWMVKSGLEEPESQYQQPKVSPYRLAGHLMVAFGLYSGLLWTAFSVARPQQQAQNMNFVKGSARLQRIALPLGILVGLTAASGAFVAGNDAGHAFNTFPKMNDQWIPEGLFELQPWTRNFFENTATVQLDHRVLAITTLVSIMAMSLVARKLTLEPRVQRLVNVTLGISILQVTLGISTLLLYVPVSLGVAHQAGALSLFTSVLALLHALKKPSPAALRAIVRPS